jgi:ActR/RegA family two-component response regulator
MAQLTAQIVSHDEEFKRQAAQLLRACGIPIGIVEGRGSADGSHPDVAVVDLRHDASSGMAAIERLRAGAASMSIFAIAQTAEPDLILGAMRAGANEFFAWPPAAETFDEALRRTAARRAAAPSSSSPGHRASRTSRARWRNRSTARCARPPCGARP